MTDDSDNKPTHIFGFSEGYWYNPETGETGEMGVGYPTGGETNDDPDALGLNKPTYSAASDLTITFTIELEDYDKDLERVLFGSIINRWKQRLLKRILSLPALWKRDDG